MPGPTSVTSKADEMSLPCSSTAVIWVVLFLPRVTFSVEGEAVRTETPFRRSPVGSPEQAPTSATASNPTIPDVKRFIPRTSGKGHYERSRKASEPVGGPDVGRDLDPQEMTDVVHRVLLVEQLLPVGLARLLDVVRIHQLELPQTVGPVDEDVVPVLAGPEPPHLVRWRAAGLRPLQHLVGRAVPHVDPPPVGLPARHPVLAALLAVHPVGVVHRGVKLLAGLVLRSAGDQVALLPELGHEPPLGAETQVLRVLGQLARLGDQHQRLLGDLELLLVHGLEVALVGALGGFPPG